MTAPAHRRAPSVGARTSLRLRLAVSYGALTAAVVILACTYGYAVHSRTHFEQLDEMLRAAASHVSEELALADTPARRDTVVATATRLGVTVHLVGAPAGYGGDTPAGRRVPVVHADWRQHAVMVPAYPPIAALVPTVHHAHEGGGTFGVVRVGTGERWRVFVLGSVGSSGMPVRDAPAIAVMATLAPIDDALVSFGRMMLLVGAVGTLLTFGAVWWIAGRALRPVAMLTTAAKAIASSGAFDQRVPEPAAMGPRDELGQLAVTFNRMLARLEQSYATQQRFVADASHELRAPLTVIRGNLELLDRPLSAEERAVAVAEATAETDRLGRLVKDLLTLARADAGVATVRREPVPLDEVVTESLREARHLARGQTLVLDTLAPAVVTGDRDRLTQLLLIVLENAAKYSPAGSTIHVALARTRDDATVTVRDTGAGISAADLPYVFERFYRADKARSREQGGTGLGLTIAKWIVEQHAGTVSIDSVPGAGTTVRVRLPRCNARGPRSDKGPPHASTDSRRAFT